MNERHEPTGEPAKLSSVDNSHELLDRSEDYNDAIRGMQALLAHKAKSMEYWDALGEVYDKYVGEESDDPDMAEFCGVMLRAPQDKYYNDRLTQLQGVRAQHQGLLSPAEREEEQVAKTARVESNHALRDMLYRQRDNFTRKQMVGWLLAMNHDSKLSEGGVDGALAEIAVYEAASDMPEVFYGIDFGSVDDDLHGGDITGRAVDTRHTVSLDVKAGKQMPAGKATTSGIHLTIGVPTHLFDAHGRLDAESLAGVRKMIELGYQQAAQTERQMYGRAG